MALEHNRKVCAQQLADVLPVGVAIVNNGDEIVFVNKRFHELTTSQLAMGFNCLAQSIHPDYYDRVDADYRKAFKEGRSIRAEYRTTDEAEVWRAVTVTPLKNEDLEEFNLRDDGGFISMVSDITAVKTAELLQRKIAQDARDRKEQQERFIDMISHEVRNPLSAILHCAEDIMDAVQNPAKGVDRDQLADIAEAAETINLCVAHQKKIIDDVLIFSKLDASMLNLVPQRVQPSTHLATLLTMFRPELRKQKIEFEYLLDETYEDCGLDWVMADLGKMGQVLINLVSNAIKFTGEAENDRRIRVSMGASKARPPSYPPNVVFFEPSESALKLDVTDKPEWGSGDPVYIMVAVKDTGIGISDQHQKRLFERFNQATPRTDRIYGGFGLGLNISRRLCHMHGGEIGVSSKEGHGSTFGFFFTIRRCSNTPRDEPAIDELCYQIQELDDKVPDVKTDTSMSEFSKNPPARHIEEVAPIVSDPRKAHTEALLGDVEKTGPSPNTVPEEPQSNIDELSRIQQPEAVMIKAKTAKQRRVLFVEDNIINQRIASRKLKMSGFDVVEANNGREALDSWKNGTFDCILMDQEMPVMDGNSATKEIRRLEKDTGSHVPVIGVTANVRQDQQQEMLDAGMDSIMHKPYKMQDLCDKVHQVIASSDN
ncbi:hypothetical protein BJX99DRAFT_122977 [Aspergillus californicus]